MVRERTLPPGWYPDSKREITRLLDGWEDRIRPSIRQSLGVVVPHAGWFFSGRIAFSAIACLSENLETLVVIGGHLPAGSGCYCATESEFATPLGNLVCDSQLKEALLAEFPMQADQWSDNTVEIQLPLVKHRFPQAQIVWIRAESSTAACELGKLIHRIAEEQGKKVGCVGSTDLTHYGPSYAHTPFGEGDQVPERVKTEVDIPFLEDVCRYAYSEVIRRAAEDKAACSAGAALTVMQFAQLQGCGKGRILEYATSYDRQPSDSFVGYGGVLF